MLFIMRFRHSLKFNMGIRHKKFVDIQYKCSRKGYITEQVSEYTGIGGVRI